MRQGGSATVKRGSTTVRLGLATEAGFCNGATGFGDSAIGFCDGKAGFGDEARIGDCETRISYGEAGFSTVRLGLQR